MKHTTLGLEVCDQCGDLHRPGCTYPTPPWFEPPRPRWPHWSWWVLGALALVLAAGAIVVGLTAPAWVLGGF